MWLLIIVLSTMTPDNRIKTVNITTQHFVRKELCESAVEEIRKVMRHVEHTTYFEHKCVNGYGGVYK